MNKRGTGSEGERIASDFLIKNGLRIVEKNFRDRYGEIDIVAKDADTLVFVEVKLRTDDFLGDPLEAVDAGKQRTIRNVARQYLYEKGLGDVWCRFDVLGIRNADGEGFDIDWIKDAF